MRSSATLTNEPSATIPTVTDNLFSQHVIVADEVAISFQPTNQTLVTNGELTWGQHRVSLESTQVFIDIVFRWYR